MTSKDTSAELATKVAELATPFAEARGVELLDVVVKGSRGRRIVKLVADADDGLDIDVIAGLSRQLSDAMDDLDLIDGAYTLEVTSPGVDRPLRTRRDFARNVGRDVRVTVNPDGDADRTKDVEGRIRDVDEATLTVNVKGRMVAIPLEHVVVGKVVLPW